ncbi:hypothetical protein MFLAVUS_000527 [Mucor flavus]|uniref:RhoGAP-domain-containing protein n=1 Tax=Mucor flavus TaxID=439312 RepID=A0ABP9YJY6_9FUNG
MDSYYENTENSNVEECEDPHCHGCQKPIEDGSVVQFGEGIWHFECFRCAKCQKLVECYSNLLLLRDGSPICEDCSYSCHACLKTIKDEAIMTGDEAYHADCFRCVQCSKKIDDLVFTQTSKGIYCTKCHETRKQQRLKRRDERNNKVDKLPAPPVRPNPAFRISSTTSIVNAYTDDNLRTPILESNDISELNDMLMGQRNSEETIRNSVDIVPRLDLDQSDDPKVRELKKELNETKARLFETISRRALDEFRMVKDSYASEVTSRREAENLTVRLKSEITFYQQASIFSGHDFIHYSKEEIEELNKARAELEQVCHALRLERNELVNELEHHSDNIEKLLSSQKPQELHWERLQHAYQQQLDSMQKDMTLAKSSYAKLIKGREDIISDMILLNTKNAELSQLNNDLSRRVMEKEQEAKAVFAGMSFLTTPEEKATSSSSSTSSSTNKHRRNLSTGSIGITPSSSMPDIKSQTDQNPKIAQRDSFNGSAAPKLFKFRRNRSGSGKKSSNKISEEKMISIPYESKNLEPVSETFIKKEQEPTNVSSRKHHFAQTKFIRPVKCEACSEKMWRVSELKCADCGMVCHSKCVYSAPQACIRKSTDANRPDGLMFGNDLIKQVQYEKSKVPLIVEKCIETVEIRGMDYEGIYRKSGGVGQMRQIQQAFEKGELPNLNDEEKWNDICAVTSVLKQYFRELPNPLFTYELHSKFIDSMMISGSAEQLQAVTQLIQTLPIENFNTLKYLMDHLYRIQQRNKENLMTSKNIAVIFGPTLLRDQDENRDLLEMNHKIGMIEYILNHMDTLFVIETINSKSNGGVDHRRMHLPPLQPGEDLSSILGTYQLRANEETSSSAAVPPRQNAGYI